MTTSDDATRHALDVFVGALIDELLRSGLRHFCVCPGSRSTPLALSIVRRPEARLWMHLDERSAAYFGLGLAKARREPVGLVCTSGTAAANFLPAVVEAYHARVPLVVLTADRPHELRDRGAPQTIDQCRLYGTHAKWFVDLPEPDASPPLVHDARTIASRAVAVARRGPAGPVHLNCPFREPLVPGGGAGAAWHPLPEAEGSAGLRAGAAVVSGRPTPSAELVASLAEDLLACPRGLIVGGPDDEPGLAAAVSGLARALDYPILADPLSGLRCGGHDRALVLDCYDVCLRDPSLVEQLAPEVVLRFGALPTAKLVALFLQRHACRQIVVDGDGGWEDPTLSATDFCQVDATALALALGDTLRRRHTETGEPKARSSWAACWLAADRLARAAVAECLTRIDEPFEGKVFAELAELLPSGTILYAGNSMPVRDLDSFFPGSDRSIRFLANRGVNGIDGVVSSALGASAGTDGRLVLVIGDLSFYHDLNGLLAARKHQLSATIVLINNDGGGIFSFLPQADEPEHFETLFGTPHGLDFRPAVELYGGRFERVTTWEWFRSAIRSSLASSGLTVIEVPTDRQRNVALHREIWRAAGPAIRGALERAGNER